MCASREQGFASWELISQQKSSSVDAKQRRTLFPHALHGRFGITVLHFDAESDILH